MPDGCTLPNSDSTASSSVSDNDDNDCSRSSRSGSEVGDDSRARCALADGGAGGFRLFSVLAEGRKAAGRAALRAGAARATRRVE